MGSEMEWSCGARHGGVVTRSDTQGRKTLSLTHPSSGDRRHAGSAELVVKGLDLVVTRPQSVCGLDGGDCVRSGHPGVANICNCTQVERPHSRCLVHTSYDTAFVPYFAGAEACARVVGPGVIGDSHQSDVQAGERVPERLSEESG